MSELVRRLIEDYKNHLPVAGDPLNALTGIAQGEGQTAGGDHDRFLYGNPD